MEETRGRPEETSEEQRAEIITAYFQDGYTQNELGEMYGLTQARISQIVNSYALDEHNEVVKYIDTSDTIEELKF